MSTSPAFPDAPTAASRRSWSHALDLGGRVDPVAASGHGGGGVGFDEAAPGVHFHAHRAATRAMDLLPTAVFPSGYSAAAWLVGACWGGDPAGEWALLPAEGSTRRWERPARPGRLGDRFRVRVWRWLLSGQSLAVGVGVGDSVAFWVGVRPAHYGTCCCAAGSTVLWRAEDPARPDQSVARVAVVTGGSGR